MFVFGYGSLMWDGWEKEFGGKKYSLAKLSDYKRDFNKKSVKNWGTQDTPGPTLGLEQKKGAECTGTVFEFDDNKRERITERLKKREGPSFKLIEKEVTLPDGRKVRAITPINDRDSHTYIGNLPLQSRISMVKKAKGSDGACVEYVKNIHNKLKDLKIQDQNVQNFYNALQSENKSDV